MFGPQSAVVVYAGGMRYPDSGGLSAGGRARREMVRLQAAQMFEQEIRPVQVAQRLRVSTRSAYQWRRRWRAGGQAVLASRGPGGDRCRLSPAQLAKLRAALDGGPAAWGWGEDQRWTLARVTTPTGRLSCSSHPSWEPSQAVLMGRGFVLAVSSRSWAH